LRLFVAVNPPRQLRQELATRLDTPRRRLHLAWTRPEAWHLTLMFLGNWPEQRLPSLAASLQAAVARHAPFVVRPGGIAAFPDLRRPRVLFLHLDGGDALRTLAADVRQAVNQAWPDGPQDRKDWRPHLTLARVKHPLPAADLAVLRGLDLGALPAFTVTAAWLLESELRSDGARHSVRAELPLGGR
jgi:2'-5' RNA ligase